MVTVIPTHESVVLKLGKMILMVNKPLAIYKFHYLGFFVLGVIVTALIGTPIGIGIHYFSSTGSETQYIVCIF